MQGNRLSDQAGARTIKLKHVHNTDVQWFSGPVDAILEQFADLPDEWSYEEEDWRDSLADAWSSEGLACLMTTEEAEQIIDWDRELWPIFARSEYQLIKPGPHQQLIDFS